MTIKPKHNIILLQQQHPDCSVCNSAYRYLCDDFDSKQLRLFARLPKSKLITVQRRNVRLLKLDALRTLASEPAVPVLRLSVH